MPTETAADSTKLARRRLLQALAAAGAYVAIPARWETPSLTAGILPAHAQTSSVERVDGGVVQVLPGGETRPVICLQTFGFVEQFEGKPIYMLWFDVDAGLPPPDLDPDAGGADAGPPPEGTCLLMPETAPRKPHKLTIGYLAGSRGFSIDARPDYQIDSIASGGVLRPGGTAADCREEEVVTFRCGERENRTRTWEFSLRVNGDLVRFEPPATVSLFSAKLV